MDLNDIKKYKTNEDKINNLMILDDYSCSICIVNLLNNKSILTDVNSCFKITTKPLIMPNSLIISFDCEISNNVNLMNHQEQILEFIHYNIKIIDRSCHLFGIINMPFYNNFRSSIINGKIDNAFIKKFNNYYNDAN